MKLLAALAFSIITFTTAAQSAVVVPHENFTCTADINEWGYSSSCSCTQPSRYDQRIGYCVKGKYETIMVEGTIAANLVAIGGETTGISLQTFGKGGKTYELVVTEKQYKALARGEGLPFEIEGDAIVLPGVELEPRQAIIVKAYRWLD